MGQPNSVASQFDFWNDRYEGRRLFSELLGTFFLVLVAVGGGMVNARFGGNAVPYGARVVAPALMVAAIILFMGTVSGAHLNPAVSVAFALRGDFPWKRVPAYIVTQFIGAALATLLLWALIGRAVGLSGQRRVDEPGPVARARPGARRLDLVVGVSRRTGSRRGHRGGHRLCPTRPWWRPKRGVGSRRHARH